MSQSFSPTEIFKRATASTLRAIAERDDVDVGFGPEPPGLAGKRVKLPNPARDLPAEEAAQLRGAADSLALRLRYHDDAVHSKRAPGGALARSVFEAVEQARVEALKAGTSMSVSMPNSWRAETLISGMPETFCRAAVVVEAITCPTIQSPPDCGPTDHSRRPNCAPQATNCRGCPEQG